MIAVINKHSLMQKGTVEFLKFYSAFAVYVYMIFLFCSIVNIFYENTLRVLYKIYINAIPNEIHNNIRMYILFFLILEYPHTFIFIN